MIQAIKVKINPWEDVEPEDYILKLSDIKYIKTQNYEQFQDKEDWFYTVAYYITENLEGDMNAQFVTEEFKTKTKRNKRFDEVLDIINGNKNV